MSNKDNDIRWGLDNPRPFSQMKTELIREGKYDEYGNRRTVDIAGCAMPLQKIETIDEPAWCRVICLIRSRPIVTTSATG
ncbi:MAG: hypothetical protein SVW57_06770 [Thermodesulfobacteriota bacterium]|nr:hypothetical protein [Thermodesulfobacteriota bacterium]